jgi:hypothetical protein
MGVQPIERESQRYWDDMRWAREHSSDLYQEFGEDSPYGGEIWVAIYDKKVVAWADNLMDAKKIAAERVGVDPREIPVKFIEPIAAIYDQITF